MVIVLPVFLAALGYALGGALRARDVLAIGGVAAVAYGLVATGIGVLGGRLPGSGLLAQPGVLLALVMAVTAPLAWRAFEHHRHEEHGSAAAAAWRTEGFAFMGAAVLSAMVGVVVGLAAVYGLMHPY
jgi:hypothetical protein